jgi:hypothetical protein
LFSLNLYLREFWIFPSCLPPNMGWFACMFQYYYIEIVESNGDFFCSALVRLLGWIVCPSYDTMCRNFEFRHFTGLQFVIEPGTKNHWRRVLVALSMF